MNVDRKRYEIKDFWTLTVQNEMGDWIVPDIELENELFGALDNDPSTYKVLEAGGVMKFARSSMLNSPLISARFELYREVRGE